LNRIVEGNVGGSEAEQEGAAEHVHHAEEEGDLWEMEASERPFLGMDEAATHFVAQTDSLPASSERRTTTTSALPLVSELPAAPEQ